MADIIIFGTQLVHAIIDKRMVSHRVKIEGYDNEHVLSLPKNDVPRTEWTVEDWQLLQQELSALYEEFDLNRINTKRQSPEMIEDYISRYSEIYKKFIIPGRR